MGTVYRARDPILDRPVAIKTVAPTLLARKDTMLRFQREARAAARLQHPNVITIFELGEHDGTLYIAMELLEGTDLGQAMAPPERLALVEKVRIAVDVCRGLDYAHKRGVVHRDVKPANIRVLPDGTVKIVDFGIARLVDSSVTQTGIVLGTPSYLAPEVLKEARADHRADMWAVGVILYEMLAGRRPYESATIASLVYRIVHEPPPALERIAGNAPAPLLAVVEKALDKDPARRYADMAEMAQALREAMGLRSAEEGPLTAARRRESLERSLADARRLLAADDLEAALLAARRARSFDASNADVVSLIEAIEDRLSAAPTVVTGMKVPEPPPVVRQVPSRKPSPPPRPAAGASGRAAPAGTPPAGGTVGLGPAAGGLQPLPTPVLTELRLRGASVFRELATFGEPPATQSGSLSPAGDLLATAGADGAIRLWDLHSRTRVETLRTEMHRRTGHDAMPLALAFSPDGGMLASGHVDGSVHLWDVARGEEVRVRLRHEALVGAVSFSPDGAVLASGGMDSNLKLWDVRAALAGEARRELHRQPSGVTALCYVGADLILTGHANRVLRLTAAGTGRLVATLRGPEASVSVVCPSPDGRRVAVASQDRTIRIFDLEARTELFAVGGHRRPASSLSFFSDGSHLATVAQDNAVHLWDLEARSPIAALWGIDKESFASVALFGGGDHIAVVLSDGRIRVWGPAS